MKKFIEVSPEEEKFVLEKRRIDRLKSDFVQKKARAKQDLFMVDDIYIDNIEKFINKYVKQNLVIFEDYSELISKIKDKIEQQFTHFAKKGEVVYNFIDDRGFVFWAPQNEIEAYHDRGVFPMHHVRVLMPEKVFLSIEHVFPESK